MAEAREINAGAAFDLVDGPLLDRLLKDKRQPIQAVPTMLPTWNAACRDEGGGRGLAHGWHVIVAGQPGAGKSVFALNLVDAALRHGARVCFISLEMAQAQLLTRFLAISTQTSVRHLEHGAGFDDDVARSAAGELVATLGHTGAALYVNRRPGASLTGIASAVTAMHREHKCRVFIVDYLQLAWAKSAATLFEQIQEISHTIRELAAKLGVVSVGLSQFNRDTSANRASAPTPQGLMGGSVLENDADQVVLLDHSTHKRAGVGATGKVLIAKNRHGPQVEIPVCWDYRTLRIQEESSPADDDGRVPGQGDAWEPGV